MQRTLREGCNTHTRTPMPNAPLPFNDGPEQAADSVREVLRAIRANAACARVIKPNHDTHSAHNHLLSEQRYAHLEHGPTPPSWQLARAFCDTQVVGLCRDTVTQDKALGHTLRNHHSRPQLPGPTFAPRGSFLHAHTQANERTSTNHMGRKGMSTTNACRNQRTSLS